MTLLSIRVDHYHHFPPSEDTAPVLDAITNLKEMLMSTQAETTAKLEALSIKTDKIIAEVQASTVALQAAIAAAGNSTPEMDAAMARLEGALQVADDLNADAP